MKPLRSAIIGAGRISEQHLKFFPGRAGVELAAVCDLSEALAGWSAREYGAQAAYTDYREMFEKERPDVVHVCTPPHVHFPIARDALLAGAHVICEKPITPTRQEYLELAALAGERNLVLTEDHTYRFTREYLELEQLVEDGVLGEVREVEIRFAVDMGASERFSGSAHVHPAHGLPAGLIHDFLPHMTYLANRFLSDADFVNACWRNHTGNELFTHDDLEGLVIDSRGVHGRLRFSCQQTPEAFQVFVRGDRGFAEMEYFRPFLRRTHPRPGGDKLGPLVDQVINGWGLIKAGVGGFRDKVMQRSVYEGLIVFLERTYDAIHRGTPLPVTHADIDRSLALIDSLLVKENQI